jgi:hypothetical protein
MLKGILFSLVLLSSSSAFSSMRDGCFAMFQGSATNGVLCISGVNDESLSGEGTRFMFFSSGSAKWCGTTSSLRSRFSKSGASVVRFSFSQNSGIRYFLVTFPSYKDSGAAKGKIRMVGSKKTDFDYIQVSSDTIRKAGIAKAWKSPICRKGMAVAARSNASRADGWMPVGNLFKMGAIPMGVKVTFKLTNGSTVSGQMMPVLSRKTLSIRVNGENKKFPVSAIKAVKFD